MPGEMNYRNANSKFESVIDEEANPRRGELCMAFSRPPAQKELTAMVAILSAGMATFSQRFFSVGGSKGTTRGHTLSHVCLDKA